MYGGGGRGGMNSWRVQDESNDLPLDPSQHIPASFSPDTIHRRVMKHERTIFRLIIIASIGIFSYSTIILPLSMRGGHDSFPGGRHMRDEGPGVSIWDCLLPCRSDGWITADF